LSRRSWSPRCRHGCATPCCGSRRRGSDERAGGRPSVCNTCESETSQIPSSLLS
jgi:hypothetical protein